MNTPAAVVKDEFETWLADRNRWLQTAAATMLETKKFPDKDGVEALADLCMQEAEDLPTAKYRSVTPGTYDQTAARPPMRLEKLLDVNGIAAIKNGAELDFREHGLVVVYGPNGAGKTGFSRLIKQMCGAKSQEDIYSNVFETENPPTSAKALISIGDTSHVLEWSSTSGALSPLRNLHVFDSKTASIYVFGKTEASYEPSKIRFVSSLIRVSDEVNGVLSIRKSALISKLPTLPNELAETKLGKWVKSLTAKTTPAVVEANCNYTEAQKSERLNFETSLAQKDIAGRLKTIVLERTPVVNAQTYLTISQEKISTEKISAILNSRLDAKLKRTAASEDSQKLFAESNVEGIGSPSWRLFWEHAKTYSTTTAYKDKPFPNIEEGAKCLLCHQDLDAPAKIRLSHFQNFIAGKLEAEAKAAEKKLNDLVALLPLLPSIEEWNLQFAVLKAPEEVATLYAGVQSLKMLALSPDATIEEISPVSWERAKIICTTLLETLASEEKFLQALQNDEKRKEIEAAVLELKAREWLSQNKAAIQSEIVNNQNTAKLTKAISLASTTSLTKKNNELAESEISKAYQDRFADELKKLGGNRLKVAPQSKKEGKGKTSFGIILKDVKVAVNADKILSEGEARVIALAAFLADITGNKQSTPFVFDDPISSLDQDFEERVVSRLVNLAKERQVIIFTHRLSLLALIESEIKAHKETEKNSNRKPLVTLKVETLRRMDKFTGVVVPQRLRDLKPEKCVTVFQNELIPKAKKMLAAADAEYERYASGVCSDLRILVEKTVETVLLNEVVLRFRRSVTTQNRISGLAKISEADCAFFDDLMTRYSVFEHSQSDELAAPVPELTQLEADVNALAGWMPEFDKRQVPR